ncbi:MAG: helix-turn-helix transcriptional regulator [Chloroflexi bacterium]|nr:helix-turn-helix transcriptional regulator [Chloroflexota bacterium]
MGERPLRQLAERIDRIGDNCHDGRALRVAILHEIGRNVAFDAYAWLLTDPETEVGSDPLADVPCLSELPQLIRLKYSTEQNRWTRLASTAGRLQADTSGEPDRSLVWRELLRGYNVSDIASVVFRDRFGCWGFLDLWRIGGPHFTDPETEYLATIAPRVTDRLRGLQARTFLARAPLNLPEGAAVLVLAPDLQVRAQTAQTEAYLRALVPPDGDRQPVPAGAYNVGAQLIASEAGVDNHPARARVHLKDRGWLSLRAARMAGPRGNPTDIAVTIETASVVERMGVFTRAYGLSLREAELLAALAGGSDSKQLAAQLYISENTVQDHLKSIFAKTGARNRRVLMARVLGS